jgi:hypothetical protein
MSNESRRLAKARRAEKRLQQAISNPVIDENDPTAFVDEVIAGGIEVIEALEPHKPGRPRSAYQPTQKPRTRAEGVKWIKAHIQQRKHAIGYTRLPRNAQVRRSLVLPAVEEANRMLPNLAEPFTVEEFTAPQHRVSPAPLTDSQQR